LRFVSNLTIYLYISSFYENSKNILPHQIDFKASLILPMDIYSFSNKQIIDNNISQTSHVVFHGYREKFREIITFD